MHAPEEAQPPNLPEFNRSGEAFQPHLPGPRMLQAMSKVKRGLRKSRNHHSTSSRLQHCLALARLRQAMWIVLKPKLPCTFYRARGWCTDLMAPYPACSCARTVFAKTFWNLERCQGTSRAIAASSPSPPGAVDSRRRASERVSQGVSIFCPESHIYIYSNVMGEEVI